MDLALPFIKLLVFVAVLAIAIIGVLGPLMKSKKASFAVLWRNFVGYFSNPTGYVFICVFMLLSSIAAFWPDAFFNDNLATLTQLNHWFPLIMLVFIPAITMSIWSEERREGTDELLLTIPATDLDIVLGKYLAAVSIFSVSLLLSMLTNFIVLASLALGDVDVGLFITTYIGYWFIGIAMLALGMVASFLTSNLTIGFILGALFNVPLAFLMYADRVIPQRGLAQDISWWSYAARFADFGRGVLSLGSIAFFLLIAVFGVYLSLVMIGRRHWFAANGRSMLGHFVVRSLALFLIALAGSKFLSTSSLFNRLRVDATSGKISSLAPDTKKLLRDLDPAHGVLIEAYISREVPQAYVNTRVDLINLLREFEALGGKGVEVRVYDDLEPFTEQATRAEEQYGISARRVTIQSRGGIRQEELFLGAAFTSGLQRVVIPFFDQGIPVEYELMRSIDTVVKDDRKRVGVIKTDVELFGGFNMQAMQPTGKQLIIEELEKQYEVEEVDPSQPMQAGTYDVLMVAQPSSLPQSHLDNLIAVIRDGQPTAIFEDPLPVALNAPATGEPRRPSGGMFGMGAQPPEPKGNIQKLWDTLGISMVGEDAGMGGPFDANVVWQQYNPYGNKVSHQQITPEWVFVSPDAPGAQDDALNMEEAVTSGLSQLLFLFPGGIRNMGARDLDFTPLARTGDRTGTMTFGDLRQNQRDPRLLEFLRSQRYSQKRYIIGARIRGYLKDDLTMSDARSPLLVAQVPQGQDQQPAATDDQDDMGSNIKSSPEESREKEIHVIYVADIDLISSEFLMLRAQPDPQLNWDFDNVTFVLNVLDSLAGDESLIDIRKRKTRHSTLKLVELKTEIARNVAMEEIAQFDEQFNQAEVAARERLSKNAQEIETRLLELQEKAKAEGQSRTPEIVSEMQRLGIQQRVVETKLDVEREKLQRERDSRLQVIQNQLAMQVRKIQTQYKLYAAFLPLLPPFIVGLLVWNSRANENEKPSVRSDCVR